MTTAPWSPTDLNRQRLIVRDIALRALEDRRRLFYARRELVARVHDWIRSPAWFVGCFAAGWLVALAMGGRSKTKATKRVPGTRPGWRERLGTISASIVWLMQQYKQGERFAARLSAHRAAKQRQHAEEPAVLSQPPIAT